MVGSIERLNMVTLASAEEARAIGKRIAQFVGTPQGQEYGQGPNRAVVVAAGAQPSGQDLYLSDGALAAASASGLNLQPALRVSPEQLPRDYSLLLGELIDVRA